MKKNLHTFTGDGAFAYTHDHVILPFLHKTAGEIIGFHTSDWSLANRIKTDGGVIQEGIQAALKEKAAVVKYPGASATAEELKFMCDHLGCEEPTTALGKGKSPNAPLRGIAGFDASIIRTPTASAALVKPLETAWQPSTPVSIKTLETGGRGANAKVLQVTEDKTVQVVFVDDTGKETVLPGANGNNFMLKPGSTLSLTSVDKDQAEKLIRNTFEQALEKGADLTFTNKNTVLTSVDAPLLKKAKEIYEHEFKDRFAEKGLHFHSGLVDDAFAFLMAGESKRSKPLIMLCPDDLYGKQIQYVLEAVKQKGLHYKHTEHAIAVGRLSNGYGDEYGGVHFTPKSAGKLQVRDSKGAVLQEMNVQPGQMCLASGNSAEAATDYARRMIDYALGEQICGQDIHYLYFGFDAASATEAPLIPVIQQVIDTYRDKLNAKNIVAKIAHPAQISAEMLTQPPKAGVILALNNLWGDIMADLFPALANNKASYDSLLLSDKGFLVETGAGGTAPDLLFGKAGKTDFGMIHTGHMLLNPIAILSSYAEAIRYTGKHSDNTAQLTYADQLHEAIILTLKEGYLTGDLMKAGKHQLREDQINPGVTPQAVDTRVFVKAVEANLLALQGKTQAAQAARSELASMEKQLNLKTPQALTGKELEEVLAYATAHPGKSLKKKAA